MINKTSNDNLNNDKKKKTKKRKFNKNNSAIELIPNKKVLLPPLSNKINIENENSEKEDIINSNELSDKLNKDYIMKKSESNYFEDISSISDNNFNFNKYE